MSSVSQHNELVALFGKYNKRLGILYSQFVKSLCAMGYTEEELKNNPLFNFNNFPQYQERLNDIFQQYVQDSQVCTQNGIRSAVSLAYTHDGANLGKYTILTDKALESARKIASEAFIRNRMKPKEGLGLSQIIWNYCSQGKTEFEMAMSNVIGDGLQKGVSAEELSRSIRSYLNTPDRMYRRYHEVVIDNAGNRKDVAMWRRRVVGEDGKIHFIKTDLEHVGQGQYRSSRMNALRMARTEINAAYHTANNERWSKEPFVIGVRVWLSPQHPEPDICDDLAGNYPKDFKFTGWHAQCMCASSAILCSKNEFEHILELQRSGEDVSHYQSPEFITDTPQQWKDYILDRKEKFIDKVARGKEDWAFRDNRKYWIDLFNKNELKQMGIDITPKAKELTIQERAAIRHSKRTENEKREIQANWNNRGGEYVTLSQIDKCEDLKDLSIVMFSSGVARNQIHKTLAEMSLADAKAYCKAVTTVSKRFNLDAIDLNAYNFGGKNSGTLAWAHGEHVEANTAYFGSSVPKSKITETYRNCVIERTEYYKQQLADQKIQLRDLEAGWANDKGFDNWYKRRISKSKKEISRLQNLLDMGVTRHNVILSEETFLSDAITHEMGHVAHNQITGGLNFWLRRSRYDTMEASKLNDEINKLWKKYKKKGGGFLSEYGLSKRNEFISESMVLYIKQPSALPEDVRKWFDSLRSFSASKNNASTTPVVTIHRRAEISHNEKSKTTIFEQIKKAKTNREKVDLMRSIIEGKSSHYIKMNHISTKTGSIFTNKASEYDIKFKTETEMPGNLIIARKLTRYGYDIYLMPNPSKSDSFDFIIKKDNKLYSLEGKVFNGKSSLLSDISKGSTQSNRVVVDIIGNDNAKYILGSVIKAFNTCNDLNELWLFKGSRLIKVNRQRLTVKDFEKNFVMEWRKRK